MIASPAEMGECPLNSVSHTEIFDVPAKAFYATIIDYTAYPEFVENVKQVRILKRRKDGARARFFIHVFRDFSYTLDLHHEPYSRVYWNLVSGDLLERMDGEWRLKQKSKHKLEVTYTLDLALKFLVPNFIARQLAAQSLPRLVHQFYQRAVTLSQTDIERILQTESTSHEGTKS
jgi:ribosome-associated toxin RatA of RatAB toxin-antitoxin module